MISILDDLVPIREGDYKFLSVSTQQQDERRIRTILRLLVIQSVDLLVEVGKVILSCIDDLEPGLDKDAMD